MSQSYVLSFANGITVDTPSFGSIVVQMPVTYREYTFKGLSPGLSQAIHVLSSTGATEDELVHLVEEADGTSSISRLYYFLSIFAERKTLSYGISCDGRPLATLAPTSASFSFLPIPVTPQAKYSLSRFAYLHVDGGVMVMESPLSHGKITLHGWEGAAVAAELARAQNLDSLCRLAPRIPRESVVLFLEMLSGARFLSELKSDDPYPGENEVLAQWDFHDLLFHARSRLGRHANPYGGTYRFLHKIEPLPVVEQSDAEETIDLPRPDIDSLELQDFPFTLVLEERRSIRDYGACPITKTQLGEFLYRTARVKELLKQECQDLSRRPYPGGGAIYELEIYLNVQSCENIPPGLYHYCPKKHRLEKTCGPREAVEQLLKDAANAAGLAEMPQVLIIIAARFQRLSWKYQSMAYNVLLKNVGALYQTMYLVATAMDLAPCALGGGDSDLFARATGLDYYAETSVGEFLLGSKRV